MDKRFQEAEVKIFNREERKEIFKNLAPLADYALRMGVAVQ